MEMTKTKSVLVALLAILSCSCDMIEYHPYDLDIDGKENINAENIGEIEQTLKDRDEISFVVISDTQRWYDETEDAVAAINKRNDIDFVLHTGDLSDFGAKLEFELQRDILEKLRVPYVCVLGNHDCVATGKQVFNRIFGDDNFAFTAGNIRFICLNTNALEFDYSEAVPDFSFMQSELDNMPSAIEKTVVAMHSGPYSEQFNNNIAPIFHHFIKRYPQLQFCVYGHGHNVSIDNFFDDGILYYECASAKRRSYLHFTIHKNGYDYEAVNY